jgi:putative restriction endonuclease
LKAVFDTKPNSGYDDEIVRRYHFPSQSNYVAAAQAAVGNWIVYREPQRNGGRRAYIAVARVVAIEADRLRRDHAYALPPEKWTGLSRSAFGLGWADVAQGRAQAAGI